MKIWIWFNFFLWFYLSSKHGGLEFHVNVKTFWILFMMNKMIKYFYVTEFDTRVFSRLCLLVTFRSENSGCLTAFMTEGGLGRGCHCKAWKILKRPSQRQHCLHILDFYQKVLQSWLPLERFVAFFCKVLIMVIYQRTSSFFMTLTHLKTQMFLMKVMGNLTLMIWMTVSVYPCFVFIRVTFSSSLRPYIFLTTLQLSTRSNMRWKT